MLFSLNQIEIPLECKNRIAEYLPVVLNVPKSDIEAVFIDRVATDYRKKGKPHLVCNAIVNSKINLCKKNKNVSPYSGDFPKALNSKQLSKQKSNGIAGGAKNVSIIGAGPAGLWAALGLLHYGIGVNLYEQGKPVEERFGDIRRFLKAGIFLPNSNVLFGEGGAGAFSDGKLNTRNRSVYTNAVLFDLIDFGADKEIAYLAKPHIGTDKLQFLIKAAREKILNLGGKIHFNSCLQNISVKGGQLNSFCINGEWKSADALVLAVGHSARNVYDMLKGSGVALQGKSFAMGARIEHLQSFIDKARHGAPDYTLTAKTAYSFCMCPGGVLIPCASEEGGFATNGMSYSRRNAPFANAGIVAPQHIDESDLETGIKLQREIEQSAFAECGKNFNAPAQKVIDFLKGKISPKLPKSSYPRGLQSADLHNVLPEHICKGLEQGLQEFEKKIPGFIENGLLVAPETRTSSPLRILRDENFESVSAKGIFAIGEGAGYAGGILTSAADGLRFAMKYVV